VWWLAGFYLLLAVLLYLPALRSKQLSAAGMEPIRVGMPNGRFQPLFNARLGWKVLAVWMVVGLVLALIPPKRDGLRCTFLAVGHGCGVLVELPNGRTLLYDAGSLDGGRSAERRIEGALWDRKVTSLDAIVVSHADVDHFNGVPGLLESFRTANVLTSKLFLDFDQPPVREMCEAAYKWNVPIDLVSRGDRLTLDDNVQVEVVHPRGDFQSEHDNATSVVLAIRYAGRRVLLTGDLEGSGLDELLECEPMKIDVMLSPHHGSPKANPARLAEWAQQPAIVVASSGRRHLGESLQNVYGEETRVLSTADHGAVTVQIDPHGQIDVSCFLDAQRQ
jgi:competence protein ComEC